MKILYDKDANMKYLKGKTVAILGFGSQGHAHALNLHESGVKVVVGLRDGSASRTKAEEAGLTVRNTADAANAGDLVMMLLPDELQANIYRESVAPHLQKGNVLMFAHGFNIHYNQIEPPANVDVVMVAPKGPGHLVRRTYQEGSGVPCLLAVHQNPSRNARAIGLAYARAIGGGRAGIIETDFREETETDLFGEQVVLCGGITALVKAAFDILVEAGYQPEMAYFECLHELKLIVDLIYAGGLSKMRNDVSNTAEYGDLTRGPRLIDESVRERMRGILKDVQNGEFAREWVLENRANQPVLQALRRQEAELEIERVGKDLRSMMSWLKE